MNEIVPLIISSPYISIFTVNREWLLLEFKLHFVSPTDRFSFAFLRISNNCASFVISIFSEFNFSSSFSYLISTFLLPIKSFT
ncbi:hypothetical protein EHP00_2083 [Ecytonucleospora hepatopenaei]|uniref:Uncharacterized protein n=1 Tax=Ecytonucleospora hepatopenaei TaxID=646526 RepID=A0A1W0E244_9MICR|nr:hypothetical protein EHP00_2083 [Ecytonucleospora hepatopenaei]